MNTPICDFVRNYEKENVVRLHMPGHKGKSYLGFEGLDITEIDGADSLFEADGIICESEKNADEIFGHSTFYSCEGSSLCIRAMLYLACTVCAENQERPLILAGRNAHKAFISAAALLGFDCEWLYPDANESYLSCRVDADKLDAKLASMIKKPVAVYLTSPDYLGNICDIPAISSICKKYGVLLLVDNAHGAYLKFLKHSQHPIDLGADMCCDSAHKTLPVLTGGAYLHINSNLPFQYAEKAKNALSLFASTSPSYLILQSLDWANPYLYSEFSAELNNLISEVKILKKQLTDKGYCLVGDEDIKLTVATKPYGYYGYEIAEILKKEKIVCEFYDKDYVVLMFTPEIDKCDIIRLKNVLLSVEKKAEIDELPPAFSVAERIISIREAAFAPYEFIPVEKSEGRILSLCNVSCPPAVPIIVPGEKIDKNAVECFKYYKIETCAVIF